MRKYTKLPAPTPPKPLDVDVKNPRYEGATPGMVVKALFRRGPKTDRQGGAREKKDDGPPGRGDG